MKLTVPIIVVADVITLGLIIVLFSGCAIGGGASVYSRTTNPTNGVESIDRGRTLPFIVWGDARQAIGSQKVANTKTGNSIGQQGLGQETSATNVAPILKGGGALIGEAARTFMGVP